MKSKITMALAACLCVPLWVSAQQSATKTFTLEGNPIVRDNFTADPAPMVHDGTLYLYVGHDEAKDGEMFNITEWL